MHSRAVVRDSRLPLRLSTDGLELSSSEKSSEDSSGGGGFGGSAGLFIVLCFSIGVSYMGALRAELSGVCAVDEAEAEAEFVVEAFVTAQTFDTESLKLDALLCGSSPLRKCLLLETSSAFEVLPPCEESHKSMTEFVSADCCAASPFKLCRCVPSPFRFERLVLAAKLS